MTHRHRSRARLVVLLLILVVVLALLPGSVEDSHAQRHFHASVTVDGAA